MSNTTTPSRHAWRFFRAGGFDQVRIDSGADIANLDQLDQKLWVALACPTRGIEFDTKTLDLIDTDKDGRIRAPEIIAASKWAVSMLKNPDDLVKSSAALPLEAISEATAESKQLKASARQILVNLGKDASGAITVDDTADTAKIFAQTKFNGDGIIPPDAADDPRLQAIVNDIIACLGADTDRSGKPGITQAKVDQFFDDAAAFVAWSSKAADAGPEGVMLLGPNTPSAAAALKAVASKIEDYFARCRLASFDPRATEAVNLSADQYAAIAGKSLSLAGAEFTGLPLARIEPGRPLPLKEGLNPGWRTAIVAFEAQVVKPLLGDKISVTEQEFAGLVSKLAPYDAWLQAKAGARVEKLGLARVNEILAYAAAGGQGAKAALTDLIAQDKKLEPEANAIAAVDRLVRYYRDLYKLLNNYVAFRDFYSRKDKAVFQAGTLYLDQRSCDLCIRVEDAGKHGMMAQLSYTYLAYCDLNRKASGEKMSVACAFTAGDSDNLMVGRNGIFYDRHGRDWDATITKIIEQPISIRQAFWLPYKRLVRWIEEQVAKRAAAADSASTTRLQSTAAAAETAVTAPPPSAPPKPPEPPKKLDVGAIAVLSLVFTTIGTIFGALLNWIAGVPLYFIPLYIIGVMLLISTPSMILAALKLRQRNLGPILDANGWAVNARAKVNIPFGGALTHTPKLPPGSSRDMFDPYGEKHGARNLAIVLVLLAAFISGLWYFGVIDRAFPGFLPESGFMQRQRKKHEEEEAAKAAAAAATMKAETTPATRP